MEEKPASPTLVQKESPVLDSWAVWPGALNGVGSDFNVIGGVGLEAVECVRILRRWGELFLLRAARKTGFPVGHGVLDNHPIPFSQDGGQPAELDRFGGDVARLKDLGVTLGHFFGNGELLYCFLTKTGSTFHCQFENVGGALVDIGGGVLILLGRELQGGQGIDVLPAKLQAVTQDLGFCA